MTDFQLRPEQSQRQQSWKMAGELPGNWFGEAFEATGSAGHKSGESARSVLEELRTFQPYLMKRLGQIEESGRKLELQEEVEDIQMYLEIMSDCTSDRMHGLVQLKSYINKLHEMVYKNPVHMGGRRRRQVPEVPPSTTSSAGTKEDDKMDTCSNEGRNLDEITPEASRKDDDFTNDWLSPESCDLFDNWSSDKFRAKHRTVQQCREDDDWGDASKTDSKSEPTVDDLNMYFERRPKPEGSSTSFNHKRTTFEACSSRDRERKPTPTWLEDPRTRTITPPPRPPTPPMQHFPGNHWLYDSSQPHNNQPDVVPPPYNNYYHNQRPAPSTPVAPMAQPPAYPIPLSACPPTTFYIPGQGYITLPANSYIVAGAPPVLNSGQVPLACKSEQMPSQNVRNPLFRPTNTSHSQNAPVQSIEEITKAKAKQCFLKKNEDRKNHYRSLANCRRKATKRKPSTSTYEANISESSDEHDNFVDSPPSPTLSPPPTVLPTPKKTSPVVSVCKKPKPTKQHDPKLQNIVNKIKAKHDQHGKEVVGTAQTIRKQLQVEGFYKLGQREPVFEVKEKDSCSDADEEEVKKQSSSKRIPKKPGTSALDGGQSKSKAMEILKKTLISCVNEREANELLATTEKLEAFYKKLNDDMAAAKNTRKARRFEVGVTKQTPKSKKQQTKTGTLSLKEFYSEWIDNMGFTDSSTSDGESSCTGRNISSKRKGQGRQTRSTVGKAPIGKPSQSNLRNSPLVPSSSSSSSSEPIEGRTRSSKRKILTSPKALVDNIERNRLAKKQLTKLPKKAVKRINSDDGNSPQKGRGHPRKVIVEETEEDKEQAERIVIERMETMFKPHISKEGREVIGPRDVVVNTVLGKIKLETDYEYPDETVVKKCKEEELEQEIEEEDNFVQFQHLYPSMVMDESGNIDVPSNPGDDADSDALLIDEYEDMEGIVVTVHESNEQRIGIEAEVSQKETDRSKPGNLEVERPQFYKCSSWMKWYDIL